MKEFNGYQVYRDWLAGRLLSLRLEGRRNDAKELHSMAQQTPEYAVSYILHRDPGRLGISVPDAKPYVREPQEEVESRLTTFYRSNEFYLGLKEPLKGLGGIGIAVGSDQPLDFFVMGDLQQMYAVDFNPDVSLVTRAYLELGSRLHQVLDRYPTTDEFISMFGPKNLPITLSLLAEKSSRYNFSLAEVKNLESRYTCGTVPIDKYLTEKRTHYESASWIGTNANLAHVIKAYEQADIKVCKGSIVGDVVTQIAQEVKSKGEQVSFVYTSNALVHGDFSYQKLQQLPFAENAKIVFSEYSHNSNLQPPSKLSNYRYALEWIYLMFSPQEHTSRWPDIHGDIPYSFRRIGDGCYFIDNVDTLQRITARIRPRDKTTFRV